MGAGTRAWDVSDTTPRGLSDKDIGRESDLERWIENSPELISQDLVILARQLQTASGPLDILALDKTGSLVVIELKKVDVYRTALAQVVDYAAWIAARTYDELKSAIDANRKARGKTPSFDTILREHLGELADDWDPEQAGLRLVVAGTGADDSLRRMIDFLAERYKMPINGVFFDVFENAGRTILVRSTVLSDEQQRRTNPRSGRGVGNPEELIQLAHTNGTGTFVEPLRALWLKLSEQLPKAEKGQFWTLRARENGQRTVARLDPMHARGAASLNIRLVPLAEDVGRSSESLRELFVRQGATVANDEAVVVITNETGLASISALLSGLYELQT